VQRSRLLRISAKDLRRWFDQCVHGQPLGEITKCKHLTQADEIPPTFVLFVKDPKRVRLSELKYLERKLRETFGFDGVPIRWITKAARRRET
jgi:predicted GTPase